MVRLAFIQTRLEDDASRHWWHLASYIFIIAELDIDHVNVKRKFKQ